jgi:hypothetical protein
MYSIVYNTNYFGCDFGCIILSVWKVLRFEVLLLKAKMVKHGKTICVIVHHDFPNVNDQIDSLLTMIITCLWCMLCEQSS